MSCTSEEPTQLDALTAINLSDLVAAFGVGSDNWARPLLKCLFRPAARRFARQIEAFDRAVASAGLGEASKLLLQEITATVKVSGPENVPQTGPTLIVANHPGLTDTLALFATLPRNDLKVIAAERPFLKALGRTSQHLIYVPPDGESPVKVLRQAARHLKAGGAVLTFPGGQIEPDPAVWPGADESLKQWSQSIGVLVKLVREIQVVPAIIRGVVSPAALHSPLTKIRRSQKDREALGATLQIIFPALFDVTVRVAYGQPLAGACLARNHADPMTITSHIVKAAKNLMRQDGPEEQLMLQPYTQSRLGEEAASG